MIKQAKQFSEKQANRQNIRRPIGNVFGGECLPPQIHPLSCFRRETSANGGECGE